VGNLFVVNNSTGNISEYTTTGALVNPALISLGSNVDAGGIAVSGTDLYVTNASTHTVGKYTTSGATVNASLITGLSCPLGIAVSGTDLFVVDLFPSGAGVVRKYTTSGIPVNTSLITGLDHEPYFIAASGGYLYVEDRLPGGTIGKYTLSGVPVNPSLVTVPEWTSGIVVSGTDLYALNGYPQGYVDKYDTDGHLVTGHLFETGSYPQSNPSSFGLFDGNLFVLDGSKAQRVREYTTDGALVNASLITFPDTGAIRIAVAPTVPEPSTLIIWSLLGGLGIAVGLRRRRKAS
jgi:hypothetical protein